MNLTDIKTLNSLMQKYGVSFSKKFGQNFLINPAIPCRIAEECGADSECGIIEIGPGAGTMTVELAKRYKKVIAVEIDKTLIPLLNEVLTDFENVKIINEDILKTDIKDLINTEFQDMKVYICANLPYYITTPIIMQLLESEADISGITVMVQKEVAQRLCSKPGDAEYGAITASISYYGSVKRLFSVSSGNFLPAPKVDSAVIKIDLYKNAPVEINDKGLLFRVIKGAFAQRRKTLSNSLISEFPDLGKDTINQILNFCNLSASVRGECLSIDNFADIANEIYKIKASCNN